MATSYYSTGTVSLTNGSALVTGNGTGWQIALISGGNVMVQAPGNVLPIASVDSDTQITSELQWTGETGEYAYTIQRDTAYLQSLDQNSQNLSYLLSELRAGTIFKYDQSGDLAGRDLYDARPKNFGYLVTIGVSEPQFYVKASNTEGDWAGPFPYGVGPVGPAPALAIGTVTTRQPGQPATAEVVGGGGSYSLDLGIPAGLTGINHRGTYSSSLTYAERDAVLHNGSSWMALQATTANTPPGLPTTEDEFWRLIAAKGLDGTGAGDMVSGTYDPQNKQADAFDRSNHTGFAPIGSTPGTTLPDRAYAIASYHPAVAPDFIQTAGYASAGDGGGALYKKVSSEPTHAGKFSITLVGMTVQWYEIAQFNVNVKMFGAVGDGVADDVAAIQDAIDYVGGKGGGKVTFPKGIYLHSSEILIGHHYVTLEGEGYFSARLTRSYASGNSVHFTRGGGASTIFYSSVKNLRLSSTVKMTDGALIRLSSAHYAKLEDLKVDNGFIGVHVVSCTNFNFENVDVATGDLYPVGDEAFAYVYFDEDTEANPRQNTGWVENCNWRSRDDDDGHVDYGCRIATADGIWFETVHIGNASIADIYINPKSGTTQLTGLDFHNCWLDQGGTGAGLIAEGGTTSGYGYFSFVGGKVTGGGTMAQGLRFAPTTGVIRQLSISDMLVVNLRSSGMQFQNVEGFKVSDCTVRNVCTVNAGHGIYVISGCKNYQILDNMSGFQADETTISKAGYGIFATGSGYTVRGNDVRGNTTGGLFYNGTPEAVNDNVGHSPLWGSVAWDPPSLVNGAQAIVGANIPGAALGDIVEVSWSASTAAARIWGYVNGAGTVAVVLTNNTGGTVDLAAGTAYIKVTKRLVA